MGENQDLSIYEHQVSSRAWRPVSVRQMIAAVVAAVLLVIVDVFQLALAFGAPAGAAAWGGTNPGVLPTRLRLASAVAGLFFYPAIILIVLEAGDVIDIGWEVAQVWLWVVVGFFSLGVLANLASRSRAERIWAPVSLGIAVSIAFVAMG